MEIILGILFGAVVWFIVRCVLTGFFTVEQNERAVKTTLGRVQRVKGKTTLDLPMADHLSADHKTRYIYPQVRVIGPGGPYIKLPWQKVHKVSVAIETASIAYDPEDPHVNQNWTVLEAVSKDQLNIGVTGQLRFKVSEKNLYAYIFGVKHPVTHIMGYFVSILRERIANFEANSDDTITMEEIDEAILEGDTPQLEGISINDLRKNLNELNEQMNAECLSSAARYGIELDASLITGIDPPSDIDSALAAINTAHNEVSADISLAQAEADQKIEQSKRAVEIQTMRVQAEVEPLLRVASELKALKETGGSRSLESYLRNVKLQLFRRARRVISEI
ncbi:MAG: SPFH domain-containing protein [Verrucomicrobiales bacterium]|jgi:regulator of protease activity HflC (stomatin/prohibitin superfamily)|nr:SPFH domain-containing protein [Verrucomicrobiales bacterium]MBP9225966.1 SPFH domain-containing protein [Verrucomicrobiales bacterium]HQZ27233.1 SPFH domain-containing protein [Verrucomicrobiales bacterium]